ncbi:MAG: hypothetical protein C0404_10440 [Verrucomicrobia bacterium]|nr:hypothetical protein [Verrucomicrobiota bacterium]
MLKSAKKKAESLDYLKYHIANAVNASFDNRGFSRFLKRELVGAWTDGVCRIRFQGDATFDISGSPKSMLIGSPTHGQWGVGRNMMFLMDVSGLGGIRTQVIDLRENSLFLPGSEGSLHTVYVRT